jgi:hypothetical protein
MKFGTFYPREMDFAFGRFRKNTPQRIGKFYARTEGRRGVTPVIKGFAKIVRGLRDGVWLDLR